MKRKLSLLDLLAMSVGNIIGVGIFTNMPVAIGMTGRSVFLAVVIGTLLCILLSLPQAILASLYKVEGGAYSQGMILLPGVMGGANGLLQIVSYLGFGTYPIGMALYTIQLFPNLSQFQIVLALLYLTTFFILGIFGPQLLSKLQNIMVILLLVAIGVFIFGGLPAVQPGYFDPEGMFLHGGSGLISATGLMAMACIGGTAVVNLGSEAKKARRDIPLAMIGGTAIVAIIYCFVGIVASGILNPEEVAAAGNLGVVAERFLSHPMYIFFVVGGALFALGTTFNSLLAFFKYPWLQMAEDGWLPKCLLKTTHKFQYPWLLMLLAYIIGGLFPILFQLGIADIIALFSVPSFLILSFLNFETRKIPQKHPEAWEKSIFHMPNYMLTLIAVAGALAELYIVYAMSTFMEPAIMGVSLGFGLFIVLILFLRHRAGKVTFDQKQFLDNLKKEL